MNDRYIKLKLVENFFLNRKLTGGEDVKALPLHVKNSMLDVIGKTIFTDEWTVSSGEIKEGLVEL
jgi:hypothetical protein